MTFQRAALGRDRAVAFTQATVPGGRSKAFHGSCSFRVVHVLQLASVSARRVEPFDGGDDAPGEAAGEGIARYAMLAAIGQPIAKADLHRITKPFRQPVSNNVNAPLTTKTMMAVITTGKMNLALPSMRLSEPSR